MKWNALVLILLTLPLLGLAWHQGDATTVATDPGPDPCLRDEPSYIGVKGCKTCHFAQWRSWKKTTMAKSFDTLKPGNAVEAKQKHGLDPQKDYTKSADCVPCHTTGYGKSGGYPAIVEGKAWTADETKRAGKLEGVQCEACHGPGSLTAPYKKDHEDYKKADILKLGMIEPDEANCVTCHNSKSPTVSADQKFDYKAATKDAKKIHKHKKLKKPH